MPVFKCELSCFKYSQDILNNSAFGRDVNDLSGSSGSPVSSVPHATQKIVSCEATAVRLYIQLQLNNLLCAVSLFMIQF